MSLISKSFHEGNMSFRDGILYMKYDHNAVIDENLLFKQFMFRKKITNEQNLCMIIDFGDIKITTEILVFLAANIYAENIIALALITRKGVDHIRTKLFMTFNQPEIKTKVFLSEQEAKLWFKHLRKTDYLSLTI